MIPPGGPSRFDTAPRTPLQVACVIGTRPEAIKMAPVVHALDGDPRFAVTLISTGQHRDMLAELLPILKLEPDVDLDLMVPGQSAAYPVGATVLELGSRWREARPDLVLVQGDTGSALGGALAAFYERVPVGHVEAGLRTYDLTQPFPEEMNRVLISRLAGLHFCPTAANRENLLSEGIPSGDIFVCGNTGIDTFLHFWAKQEKGVRMIFPERPFGGLAENHPDTFFRASAEPLVLVTSHRRENVDGPFVELCRALARVPVECAGARVLFPVHPNPKLRRTARELLGHVPGVELTDPMPYDRFVEAMARATILVTDSGGIQEEACAAGKPTLLLRHCTERQEGLRRGAIRIVGTNEETIVRAVRELLTDAEALHELTRPTTCFGDGTSAQRILAVLRHVFFHEDRPHDYDGNTQVERVPAVRAQ